MSRPFAYVALAGLVCSLSVALAQPGGQPAGQPPAPPPAPAAQPPAPPEPKAIPVPDGPVIEKRELEGGVIVEEIKIGTGYELKTGSAFVAHYHGMLKSDGSVFESSFATGEPLVYPIADMIDGWKKGLPGMKVGGVRKVTVPAAMGYGERASEKIPANSDLVFIVQLQDVLYIEDVKEGSGEAATNTCVAVTTQSVKDAEGKEVEKADMSAPYVWLPGEMNAPGTRFDTMQLAFDGMKVGGTRKVHIPAEMNGAPPQLEIKRPKGVPISVEFNLIAVRNLPQRRAPGR